MEVWYLGKSRLLQSTPEEEAYSFTNLFFLTILKDCTDALANPGRP